MLRQAAVKSLKSGDQLLGSFRPGMPVRQRRKSRRERKGETVQEKKEEKKRQTRNWK
jgi:hypothetical protein